MRYYYVDTENVGAGWLNLLDQFDADSMIHLFYTAHSAGIPISQFEHLMEVSRTCTIRTISCNAGRNALDFQLVTDLGYRIAGDPDGEYIIVSGDTGFDVVVNFWKDRECKIHRLFAGNTLKATPAERPAPARPHPAIVHAVQIEKAVPAVHPEVVPIAQPMHNQEVKPQPKAEIREPEKKPVDVQPAAPVAEKKPIEAAPLYTMIRPGAHVAEKRAVQQNLPSADLHTDKTALKTAVQAEVSHTTEHPEAEKLPVTVAVPVPAPTYAHVQPVVIPAVQPVDAAKMSESSREVVAKSAPVSAPRFKQEKTAVQPESVQKKDVTTIRPEPKRPESAPLQGKNSPVPVAPNPLPVKKEEESKPASPAAPAGSISSEAHPEQSKQAETVSAPEVKSGLKSEIPQRPDFTKRRSNQPPMPRNTAEKKPVQAKTEGGLSVQPEKPAVAVLPEKAPSAPVMVPANPPRSVDVNPARLSSEQEIIRAALKKAELDANAEFIFELLNKSLSAEGNKWMSYVYRNLLKKYGQKQGIAIYNAIRDRVKPYCRLLSKNAPVQP